MNKVVLCSIKNEGLYILEWVAYYKTIGFDKIIIASNNNTDKSQHLLHELQEMGEISYIDNNILPGESPQLQAYSKAMKSGLINYGDWLLVADIDEFICFPNECNLDKLIELHSDKDVICLPWKHFGSSGASYYEDDYVVKRFTMCTGNYDDIDSHFKSLFKFSKEIRWLGVHKPNYIDGYSPSFVDPAGKLYDKSIIHGDIPGKVTGGHIARINHYSVKSYQEYILRRARGNGFNIKMSSHFDDESFFNKDVNECIDRSLCSYVAPIENYIDDLLARNNHLLKAIDGVNNHYSESFSKLIPEYKYLQVFGERNTGTNWIRGILKNNLSITLLKDFDTMQEVKGFDHKSSELGIHGFKKRRYKRSIQRSVLGHQEKQYFIWLETWRT